MMKRKEVINLIFAAAISAVSAKDYDFVINKGPVMDPETIYDAIASVGVKGGTNAVITKDDNEGKETLGVQCRFGATRCHNLRA